MPRSSLTVEERVSAFFKGIERGQTLLAAVSGGPDSVCLLHILSGLRDEPGLKLHTAHLDHCLRGLESAEDAAYVAALSNRLGVPSTLDRVDVNAYRRQHRLSLEEAAREVRYRFLAETARETGAFAIAAGHTSDDNVETILMHLLRGSGTRGLGGLQPESQIFGATVVRPLLDVSRAETSDYCRRHELAPRQDASNLSLKPFRNRIRHKLIPLLKQYNPQVEEALLRTASIAAADIDFIDELVAAARGEIAGQEGGGFTLDKDGFRKLHPAIRRGLLRLLIGELRGDLRDIEAGHIELVLSSLDKPSGRKITIPGGLAFAIEYNRYVLGSAELKLSPFPPLQGEHQLNIPGQTTVPGWRVTAKLLDRPLTDPGLDSFQACLDYDKVGEKLLLRTRRRGDRFIPLGLGKETRVGRFMINARIPRGWRDNIPLLCSDRGVLWVAGYRIDNRAKVTAETKRVLCLEFRPA